MKMQVKRRLALLITGALLIGLLPMQDRTAVKAAETSQAETEQTEQEEAVITYDASEFEPLAGRTKEEAAKKYVEARYISPRYEDTDEAGIYEKLPSAEIPYDEGRLSEDTVKTLGAMCNYYRWLAGSEDLETVSSSYTQKEAFRRVQSGTPSYDYTYSEGTTPLTAVKNLMNERYSSWSNYGDFSQYLYKTQEGMLQSYHNSYYTVMRDVGFYKGWLVLARMREKKEDGTETEDAEKMPFYSFPAQGFMPNDLLKADKRAWTVWIDEDADMLTIPTEYDSKSGVQISKDISVMVLHRETGQRFERSMEQGNAFANASCVYFQEPAEAGMDSYIGTYDVEVTGLLDKATGKAAKLCYTVTFFDPAEYLYSTVREVSIDGVVTYVLPQQLANPQSIEKLTAILPKEVTVTGENGRNFILPVKGSWRYDEAGSCWINSVDASKLPAELTDPDDILTDFSIRCEVGDNQGLTFEMDCVYALNYTHPTDGRAGKIIIKRNPESAIDSAVVYQITKPEETYTAELRYDTGTSGGVEEDRETNAFIIEMAYFVKDTGDYVTVGYEKGGRKAWLSDSIIPILVTEWKPWEPEPALSGTAEGGSDTDVKNPDGGNDTAYGSMKGTEASGSEETDMQEEEEQEDSEKTGIPKVAKVKNYKVKPKKKGFALTWEKSPGVSGYQVQVSTKKNFKDAEITFIKKSKNRYTISKLEPGKKYYIRIRAYQTYQTQAGGTETSYGKWAVKSSRTKR